MSIAKTYYCDSCGGVMEFDVTSQNLKCPNCGSEIEIENDPNQVVEHTLNTQAKSKITVEEKQSTSMKCQGCGAMIEVDGSSTSTECPYCGSNYVLAEKQLEAIIPDGVIPFQITKQEVGKIFAKWIESRKFAPNELKGLYQKDKVQGIYIPYWTFDADARAQYTAMGGKRRTITERNDEGEEVTRTVTDWYPTSGSTNKLFDDILVLASDKLPKNLSNGLHFNTKDIPSYSPDYMAGYCSEIYNIDLNSAHKTANNKIKSDMESLCRRDVLKRYDDVKNVRMNLNLFSETYKYVLLPVYSTSYMYNGEQYNILINGQSGVLQGEYPKSKAKIAALVIAIILIVAIMFYFMNS